MLLWSITAWSWHPPHLQHSTLQILGFFSYLSSDHASLRRVLLRKTSGNILDISMYEETRINDVDHHCCMYACQKPHQKIACAREYHTVQKIACATEYHTVQKIACARESHSWDLCATWVGRIFGNPRIGILSPHHCHDVCKMLFGVSIIRASRISCLLQSKAKRLWSLILCIVRRWAWDLRCPTTYKLQIL